MSRRGRTRAVDAPSPESAAEVVLTENDLDETTREQLLAALDFHEGVLTRHLANLVKVAEAEEIYHTAMVEGYDILQARLNSLLY